MRNGIRNASFFVLLLVLFAACATTQSDTPKKNPVAVVGGQTIYEDEILENVRGDLRKLEMEQYQLKQRALENFVLRKILNEEAKKRGVTLDQLIQQEADAKTTEPTDAEVRAQYDAQKDTRKFEEVKEQYRSSLKQSRIRAARQAYFQKVWSDSGVQVLLRPPKTEVAADRGRLRGNPDAPITIVEFSDFQCPFCRRVQPALAQVLAKYPAQVNLSYRDFPLREIHPEAQSSAEASRCAGDQGKFWEYHDLLFGEPKFDRATLGAHAQKLGLEIAKFDACLAAGKYRAQVEEDLQAGLKAGVDSTPAFFINGVFVNGSLPFEEFDRIIQDELRALGKK